MTLLRSILCAIWVYGAIAVVGLLGLPVAVAGGQAGAVAVARVWARVALFGARWISGIRVELRGLERLPHGACIIAAKHQSMLDTIAPFTFLEGPAFVFKRELAQMPVFGWYLFLSGQVLVDRGAHMVALKSMLKSAKSRAEAGRQIVIFPEGTRRPVGAPPDYKPGVAALYGQLGVPVVPVALNTGLVWARKGIRRTPGVAVFEILEPIAPGLKRDAFMAELERRIETASDRLIGR
jgi:1-acyl-sn-glycerol-3-phosphate acyltransferase